MSNIFSPGGPSASGTGTSQVALVVKNPPASLGDIRKKSWVPGSGRSPGAGNGNPLQYSCLGNPHGGRSLVGYSQWGHKESEIVDTVRKFREAVNHCSCLPMSVWRLCQSNWSSASSLINLSSGNLFWNFGCVLRCTVSESPPWSGTDLTIQNLLAHGLQIGKKN